MGGQNNKKSTKLLTKIFLSVVKKTDLKNTLHEAHSVAVITTQQLRVQMKTNPMGLALAGSLVLGPVARQFLLQQRQLQTQRGGV